MYSDLVQQWWDRMTPEQQKAYRERTKMFTKVDGRLVGDLRAALGPERLAVLENLPSILRRLADPHRIRDKAIAEQPARRESNGADTKRKKQKYAPRDREVLLLVQKLNRDAARGISERQSALDFAEGDERRRDNLLRSVRRYRART